MADASSLSYLPIILVILAGAFMLKTKASPRGANIVVAAVAMLPFVAGLAWALNMPHRDTTEFGTVWAIVFFLSLPALWGAWRILIRRGR